DRRAACKLRSLGNSKRSVTGRFPSHCLLFPGASCQKRHTIGNHEGGIESHAELTDQGGQCFGSFISKTLQQLAIARFRDSFHVGCHGRECSEGACAHSRWQEIRG